MRFKRFQSEWWIVVFGKLINMFTNWFVAIVVFSREALEGQHTSKDCASGTLSQAKPMYVPWKPPIELAFTRQWETLKTREEISLGWPHESPCLQRRQLDLDREWGAESPPYQLDPLCHLPVDVLSISLSKCKQHAEHKWRTCWDTKHKETWNRRQRILSSQRYTRAPWRIAEFRKTLPSKIGAPPPAASPPLRSSYCVPLPACLKQTTQWHSHMFYFKHTMKTSWKDSLSFLLKGVLFGAAIVKDCF